MKKTSFILASVIASFFANSQVSLVSDIYSGASSSTPDFLYASSDYLFFTADHSTFGIEVWQLNIPGSVILNYEVNTSGGSDNAANFIEYGGKIYFSAYEGTYGTELYEYDGISAPIRVSDINPGGANSIPRSLTVFDGKLYFSASGPGNDYELYVYDGVNPPSLVANINAAASSYPGDLVVLNDKLIFSADNGVNGIELWEYDGINPPSMIMDINPGVNNSNSPWDKYYVTEFNSKLYFGATDGVNGVELWMYDGTNLPSMVIDMGIGAASFNPKNFYVYQNKLIFSGIDATLGAELWQYDGVNTPTMVFDINTNPSVGLESSHPKHFIEYNGILYFRATDELHGRELWGWNGTTDPVMIEDINPGTAHSSEDWNLSATKRMAVFNGSLYFAANDGVVGEELFKYNGCLVDASVIQNGMVLETNQTGTSYQWIDCASGNAIVGETNQTYTPTVDGDYKVVITDGLCIDTSDCFTFSGLGFEQEINSVVHVYPNPANDYITIQSNYHIESVKIYSLTGELILTGDDKIYIAELSSGMYIAEIIANGIKSRVKFVIE
ncbi:MAG: T9SS type A sorting domain-containing protein [Crocinitomicaceae bacterium]|nr:T9SS type A sorting domain-containing protein [Crocinitomicaceae bacterium]MBK8925408.1 T9SS type A sorting domain-containing protein [Crocinitomicaceae bacterium]